MQLSRIPAQNPLKRRKNEKKEEKKSRSRTSNPSRICCASTKVQARSGDSEKSGGRNSAARNPTAQGNPAADLERKATNLIYPKKEKPSPAERRAREREGRVVVRTFHGAGGSSSSSSLDWSGSGRGRATTPPQLPPRRRSSSVVAGRPPQPREKTSVALRKQTEGGRKKVGRFYFGRNRSAISFLFFVLLPTDPRIPVASDGRAERALTGTASASPTVC